MTKASIQSVAAEAGVSVSTVSRTFAKPDLVLPETRDKVLAAAQKLGFRVSRSAAALKSGRSFRIALLHSDDFSYWFNASIYAGLDSVFHPAGYDISVYGMPNAEARRAFFTELPVRRNVDAVIVCSFDIDPEEVSRLKDINVPIIGINSPSADGLDASIAIDDRRSLHIAVEHLVSLGHRHLAYAYLDPDASLHLQFSAEERLLGFTEACESHLDVTMERIPISNRSDAANTVLSYFTSASPRPTALCCQSDEIALPALYRLRQYGRLVPQDLSVIGFDDIPLSQQVGLTTLRQSPFELGVSAANKTLAILSDEETGPRFETMQAQLILRETTALISSSSAR